MKKYTFIAALLFITSITFGQNMNATFQGEIVGVTPFFLHLEGEFGSLSGYYKYRQDSIVVPIKGVINKLGEVKLTSSQKPACSFTGTLQGRTIKGFFADSKRDKPVAFYAIGLRGDYSNRCYDHVLLELSDRGYEMGTISSGSKFLVTTHMHDDGRVYVSCDSLNIKLYVKDSSLVLDSEQARPSFLSKGGECESETLFMSGSYNGDSFIEYPENIENQTFESKVYKLNGSHTAILKPMGMSDYVAKRWEFAQQQHKPYTAITNAAEAWKMLKKRVRHFERKEDGYSDSIVEITFKDGAKIELDREYEFEAYYPEVDVLYFIGGHETDQPFDLSNSSNKHVGAPHYSCLSLNKQLRLSGYFDGQDCVLWFLEKRNKATNKYEFIDYLAGDSGFDLCYSYDWLWVSNTKLIFTDYNKQCFELEVEM